MWLVVLVVAVDNMVVVVCDVSGSGGGYAGGVGVNCGYGETMEVVVDMVVRVMAVEDMVVAMMVGVSVVAMVRQ